MDEVIEIPFGRRKLVIRILLCLLLLAMGGWLAFAPESVRSSRYSNPEFIRIAGWAALLFFGFALVFVVRSSLHSKPALIISNEGITENSTAMKPGLIPWEEITGLQEVRVSGQFLFVIFVKDPEKYITRQNNRILKGLMKLNHSQYGSPLSINVGALRISHVRLRQLLDEAYTRHVHSHTQNG